MTAGFTTTISKSKRGDYHGSRILRTEDGRHIGLIPLCGARAEQQRAHLQPDTPTIPELKRQWDNTLHNELQCQRCCYEMDRKIRRGEDQ